MQALLLAPVDLVVERAIRNPYFRDAVQAQRDCCMQLEIAKYLYDVQSAATTLASFVDGRSWQD